MPMGQARGISRRVLRLIFKDHQSRAKLTWSLPRPGRRLLDFFSKTISAQLESKAAPLQKTCICRKLRRRQDVNSQVYWNPQPVQASNEHVVLSLTTVSNPGGASMPKLTSPLDHIKIAAPCSADWDQMFSFEDKRVRFCSQCNLNVYNLSDMSRQDAEALINKTEGRLCVRFYRRADGSILTQNCPVGLKAIKRRVAWVAQVVLGMVLSFVSGLGLYIFHLGRKPYPLLNIPSIYKKPSPIIGAIRPVRYLEKATIGKVMIEPRQSDLGGRGKTGRPDQGISQAAPESSSAT